MREMNSLLEMLRRGEVEKIVLVKSGEMKGVIVSVDEYSRLTSAK
jgi:hypothetical protein